MKTMLLTALFALAALPQPLAAQQERLSDDRIRHLIEDELDRRKIRPGDLEVVVSGAEVTLSGTVDNAWQKQRAVEIVMDVADVQALNNELVVSRAESDEALRKQIAERLARYTFFTVFDDVSLAVQDGHVMLSGRVTMPFKAQSLGEMASRIYGVRSVSNEIQTLPASLNDERLRQELARRIYGDTLFHEYAFWPDPPIHIVVERGDVTLTGYVRSRVEQVRAEHIARSVTGVFRVENRLRLGGS